jgi:lipoprotein-releasing system ATP-binding protein
VAATSIRAEALSKRYRSGDGYLTIFDQLNFEVQAGEMLALVGESGAGKSTLLHLLGGLDQPSGGKVFFGDKDLFALSDTQLAELRNREMGFVWQTQSLLPEFTALENVEMPLVIRGVAREKASADAMERLSEVGLAERATHRAGELSGGEQQRIALARALVGAPRVLFADEPTGNLDYKTADRIMDLLKQVHQAHGLTSVFVTHSIGFAQHCDRILQLEKGELNPVSTGDPSEDSRKHV